MAYIFIIVIVVLLLADLYVAGVAAARWPLWARLVLLIPSAGFLAVAANLFLIGDWRQSSLNWLFWLTLCVVLPTLLFVLVSLAGRGIGLLWAGAPRVFDVAGTALALAWLGISLYGITAGWKRVTTDRVEIASERIPAAFDGYRIVQLSDFHIGTYSASPATVDRIVEEVNALDPDLIVFTGDMVNSSSEELDPFQPVLARMRARDGIISVLGNHDYCVYRDYEAPDSPARQLARLAAAEEAMGWRLLRNASLQIRRGGDSIAVAGVENAGSRMFADRSDLGAAIRGLDPGEFKILLSHDPSHWRREVLPASDIDLTLSGHTHAMQFCLFGWSPSAWTYPEWGGLYEADGGRRLYVSTGTGENVAFRFGAWPRITLLTLNSQTRP